MGFVDGPGDLDDSAAYAGLGELMLHPSGTWKLLADMAMEPDQELAEVNRVLAGYVAAIDDGAQAFKQRCEFIREHKTVPDDGNTDAETETDTEADASGDDGNTPRTRPRNPGVTSMQERRGQKFAAMGVLNHGGVSLVLPLGAHDTEVECRTWIRDTVADRYPMFDIMCVQMYEWVYPHTLADRQCSTAIPFAYGGADGRRLTELMQYQVDEEKKMDVLTATMQANGVDEAKYVTELVA